MADKRQSAEHRLLVALACGATVESAAVQAGLSERSAYRRLAQPEFRRRLNQVRSDMVQRTAGLLTASAMEAVKTLLELQKPANPATVRLGAARAIIDLGVKVREASDLEARVTALEEQLLVDESS